MVTIKQSKNGIDYLIGVIKKKAQTVTKAVFWKIPHNSQKIDVRLKIGRYKKSAFNQDVLETKVPKSELTLDQEELQEIIKFIDENYEPFKLGVKKYIPLTENFDPKSIEHIKAIFDNRDKQEVLDFIATNNIISDDLILGLDCQKKLKAIAEFENMLELNLDERNWQQWFKKNDWVLGSEFVKILDERAIDTANISDYLMQAYDGFVDIVEIKKPSKDLNFWHKTKDHSNYVPSLDLTKAISQSTKYIYEVEREANSVKFLEKVGNIKTIKPRCILIFGRSNDWDDTQKEEYRILNSSYHNLTILTYDHVLSRAKRIVKPLG